MSGRTRGTVLVVEDNPDWSNLLRRRLEDCGYEVWTCEDGARALEHLRWHAPPDALVLDLGLPGLGGGAILREVRADPELDWLPVVVVTGREVQEGLGADRVFRKPVAPAAVVEVVRQLAVR
ncbi:MAG: response regulator [Myxococcaceae bacterium]|nr:response regulator [Myxococcaceae bacterium]